ncbi:MAG: class I SAM-dependent methyltransferase [Robiginitomaculum sp.]|nr:class I SAM-dependent methyltransferase [Robiginitomaculum sp.]
MKNLFLTGTALLILGACDQTPAPEEKADAAPSAPEAVQETEAKPVTPETIIKPVKPVKRMGAEDIGNRGEVMMAIQAHDRPKADAKDDEIRKAAAVLEFTGIWPGMTVVELEAGSGYYTELISRIVGKDGKVIMQNPKSFDAFIKPEVFEARLGKNGERLGNVTHTRSNFDALDVETGSADIVTWFLGPHELWMKNKDGELTLGAPDKVYGEIYRILKPGGKLVLLDHKAAPGSPVTTGGDTHRIDPAHVQAYAEKAGFKLEKTSNVLANKADDYDLGVFDPKVRRKTDRFLHMYVKPKE